MLKLSFSEDVEFVLSAIEVVVVVVEVVVLLFPGMVVEFVIIIGIVVDEVVLDVVELLDSL